MHHTYSCWEKNLLKFAEWLWLYVSAMCRHIVLYTCVFIYWSSLKISNIDDLPEAYKLKSKTSAQVTPPEIFPQEEASKKTASLKEQRPAEDSAVQGPAYKFAGAKEISIRDSIGLQKQQREHLEVILVLLICHNNIY